MERLKFQKSNPYTLGVELEFQLLDRKNLDLVPRSTDILSSVPEDYQDRLKPEFIQSMLEVTTGICTGVKEVADDLIKSCRLLEELADRNSCLIHAASLHPFAIAEEQRLSEGRRYRKIMEELQMVGRRLITQGLHVHVGLADGETAIRVCDGIRRYLPILLALTTSSPFFEGSDSGLYSYRSKLFASLPRAGMPDALKSWKNYHNLVEILLNARIISGTRDLWWDVRPHPDFGTVEVRICDLPSRFDEILAVTVLIHNLVYHLSRLVFRKTQNLVILNNNKWQATRHGLSGYYVDPYTARRCTFYQSVLELLDMLGPAARDLGNTRYMAPVRRILETGTSSHRQKKLYSDNKTFKEIIEKIREGFWQ
ncbi:MAG TPA: YbdK family carboxylate-amine ligase [Thermodesulfobacteriaceae bacterium]|nr:YbdK family carboxylate-amine ligase [Thermodesulfobacteriaceae bacterium]